jgi:CDP-4-dehydro-6-deoxyglucose reductase, E3
MSSSRTFVVTLASSGRSFSVREDQAVLEAAIAAGVHLPYACRGGSCGSCMAKVLRGEIGYREEMPPPGVTDEMRENGEALLCVGRPRGDLLIDVQEISRADQVVTRRLPARVERLDRVSAEVMVLSIRLPAVERLQFFAGQYLDVFLDDGRRRSFSIANAPHDDDLIELHVRLVEGGTFSSEVFSAMQVSSLLRIEAPLGTFFVRGAVARPQLMVAGGTGFAPIKSIIEDQLHAGLEQPIHLYWGARDEADLYMLDRVRGWTKADRRIEFTPVLSGVEAAWTGRSGLVHEAVLTDRDDLSGCDVYAAGPPAMIEAIRASFIARGLPEQQLFYDSFEFALR